MKIQNINFIHAAVVLLLFMLASCGPSGAIGTTSETSPSAFAVDVLCNGVACGDSVPSDAVIGVKVKPVIEAAALVATLVCDGIDYPLTLAGQEDVDSSRLFTFTHAAIPQVRPCTVAASLAAAAADVDKSMYIDSTTPVTVDFTIECDPTGSDDFSYAPTLEKCWTPALVQLNAAQLGGMNQGGAMALNLAKAAAPTEPVTFKTTWDELSYAGVTVEIRDGALVISAAESLGQAFVIISKSFEGPGMPAVTALIFDSGMDFRQELDFNNQWTGNYTTNESYGVVIGDSAALRDTCTFQVNAKALPSKMGGPQAQYEVPAHIGLNDWTGFKFLLMQPAIQTAIISNSNIAEAGCGFETTDNWEALMTKMNDRQLAVRQAVPVNAIYEDASSWAAGFYGGVEAREYAYGSGMAMQDYVWQEKAGEYPTIASAIFDATNGTVVGFMYQSVDSMAGKIVKGEAPPPPFVPFTLVIEDVKIEGVTAK